ncbi:MAG: tRNA-guanine transglycosylase, partial [Pseudomonadota bacterium]
KPRYLMGVGYPSDMIKAVMAGVDMFDCVLPTRNARNGMAFVRNAELGGTLKIGHAAYKADDTALDATCDCHTCKHFTRSYLHHLNKEDEILGHMLMTQHNLHHYLKIMTELRAAIEAQTLPEVAKALLAQVR